MATAFGAGAAGLSGELNPVLRQPHHASVENATGRIIVKFRPANSSPQRAKLRSTQDRIAALMARSGLKLRAVRSVTELLHGIRVEPAIVGEPIAATVQRLRADPEVEYAEAEQWRYPHATTPSDRVLAAVVPTGELRHDTECRRRRDRLGYDDRQHRARHR